MTPMLDSGDRAPSFFTGGLGKISPLYWVACLVAAAAIDTYSFIQTTKNIKDPKFLPGDLGFDPLGLYPKDEEGRKRMQQAEIKHGRLAMISVTAFAVQEYVSKTGVVDETPFFFFPLGETVKTATNSGYLQ